MFTVTITWLNAVYLLSQLILSTTLFSTIIISISQMKELKPRKVYTPLDTQLLSVVRKDFKTIRLDINIFNYDIIPFKLIISALISLLNVILNYIS